MTDPREAADEIERLSNNVDNLRQQVEDQHAEIGRLLNQLATALHHYYAAYSDAAEWEERARHLGWKDPT